MVHVKVLGPGCVPCERLAHVVMDVAGEFGLSVSVEKVADLAEMMKYGVLSTPGLVVDGTLRSVGHVPARDEIAGWLLEAERARATTGKGPAV